MFDQPQLLSSKLPLLSQTRILEIQNANHECPKIWYISDHTLHTQYTSQYTSQYTPQYTSQYTPQYIPQYTPQYTRPQSTPHSTPHSTPDHRVHQTAPHTRLQSTPDRTAHQTTEYVCNSESICVLVCVCSVCLCVYFVVCGMFSSMQCVL